MIRSLSVVLALSISSVLVGCAVDANEPAPEPAPSSEPAGDKVPSVEVDTVTPSARCPLPKVRPTGCNNWYCEAGAPGCPAVCACWD